MEGRRRAIAIGLGGAVLLALLFWTLRPGDVSESRGAPDVAAAPPATQAASTPVAPRTRRRVAETPFADLPEPIRRFLESTPYPPTSGRLSAAHEDLLRPNARHERHRPIPDTLADDPAQIVSWLFTADRWAYVGPDTVHAWLEVNRGETPIAVEIASATATREDASGPVGAPEPLSFTREGDRLVADLSLARFADHFGPIVLAVRFEYAPGRFHEDQLRIQSTPLSHVPGAVAEMEDRVSNGNLVLDVGADLRVGGFYRFDANVYDANGDPVAYASWKGELTAGRQSIPLEVWGKVLRDAGVPGPYTIGEIRGYRFLDGQYPDREMLPSLDATHTTSAWPLDVFRDDEHVSEHELHVAELMLDDLEAGRALVTPPVAADAVAPRAPDDDVEPFQSE